MSLITVVINLTFDSETGGKSGNAGLSSFLRVYSFVLFCLWGGVASGIGVGNLGAKSYPEM